MELDKKALAVTRLVAAIYEWDPRGSTDSQDKGRRKVAVDRLVKDTLSDESTKQNVINMVLAMTLLTSGHVASVRNPEVFSERRAPRWVNILSPQSEQFLDILRFPSYVLVTKQDYANAKQLLPFIGASSMLESEVRAVFSKTGLPEKFPGLSQSLDKYSEKRGIGGYGHLYRGLSAMSDGAIIRVTDLSKPWDVTRGVSTSRNYASAEGFSQKDGPNHVLISFDNPHKRGFNALKLSKFGSEEEVILSGVTKIQNYQLTFYAEEVEEDENAKDYTIQVTPYSIFVRRGLRAFYGEDNISSTSAHEFIKIALSGKPFQLTGQNGATVTIRSKPETSTLKAQGVIQ